jgi:hypothetical protein
MKGEECRTLAEQDLKTSKPLKSRSEKKNVLKQMVSFLNPKVLRCVKETQLEKELQRFEDVNVRIHIHFIFPNNLAQ